MNPFEWSFDDFNLEQPFPSYQNNIGNSMIENSPDCFARPAKQLKTNSSTSSSSQIISFDNTSSPNTAVSQQYYSPSVVIKPKNEVGFDENLVFQSFMDQNNQYYATTYGQENKKVGAINRSSTTPLTAGQDHVIAERKRREKLSQRFIALSAIIPGLKKTDKASVLGDAIKYLTHMQTQVKMLEEKAKMKTMESAIIVNKSHVMGDKSNSSNNMSFEKQLPEIEAKAQDKDVLIRIHCEKNSKGSILRLILNEIEKLHLNVVSTSVLPFGSFTLDITIIAKVDKEYSVAVKDIVKTLGKTLSKLT
ncbi:hypothetical protein ACFE04_022779 [Oxalis oulophora]